MKACDTCGRETANKRFCSRLCSVITTNKESPKRRKEAADRCRSRTKQISDVRSATSRRHKMIEKYGHRCQDPQCGLTEWLGKPIPIQVDHIDGNPDNNDESNLRLLCNNCHGSTETFGGRNVGRFPNSSRRRAFKKRLIVS